MLRHSTLLKKGISIYPRNSEFIDIISWNNILNHAYWSLYIDIFSKFIENEDFRNDLLKITHMFATRKGKYISDSKSRYLATYLIAELPTLINGIQYKDKWYRSMIYPMYRNEGIDDIAEKLIDGKYGIFPSIKNKCIIKNILIN